MSLRLGQLLYTSFPDVGFNIITSPEVPPEARQAFVQTVTHQLWDAYNPPDNGYRAVYIYQEAPDRTLFGWLYNDGADDRGRSHVPYFIGHYLEGPLSPEQLDNIFTLLRKGPSTAIDRQTPPEALEAAFAPDLWDYKPARAGVAVPAKTREQAYRNLAKGELVEMFVSGDEEYKLDEDYLAEFEEEEFDIDDFAFESDEASERMASTGPWVFLDKLPWKPIAGLAAASLIAAVGFQQMGAVVGPESSAATQPKGPFNREQRAAQDPNFIGPINKSLKKATTSPDTSSGAPATRIAGSPSSSESSSAMASLPAMPPKSTAKQPLSTANSLKSLDIRHHGEKALEALDAGNFREFENHVGHVEDIIAAKDPRAFAAKREQEAFNALIAGNLSEFKENIDLVYKADPKFHKVAALRGFYNEVEKKPISQARKLRCLRKKVISESHWWLSRDQKLVMKYLTRKKRFIRA
jgi:hypothetical protein